MRIFIVSLIFLCAFNSSAICKESTRNHIDDYMYNAIFDIGLQDRETYLTIMHHIVTGNKLKASITAGTGDDGVTDYAVQIIFLDDEDYIVYDEFFMGAFFSDYSDITKTKLDRKELYPRDIYTKQKELYYRGMEPSKARRKIGENAQSPVSSFPNDNIE